MPFGYSFVTSQDLDDIRARLTRIERTMTNILRVVSKDLEIDKMAQADIDRLKVSVAQNTSAVESAKALLAGLAQQIRDAADDPAELNALADQVDAATAGLAQAVVDNTPHA